MLERKLKHPWGGLAFKFLASRQSFWEGGALCSRHRGCSHATVTHYALQDCFFWGPRLHPSLVRGTCEYLFFSCTVHYLKKKKTKQKRNKTVKSERTHNDEKHISIKRERKRNTSKIPSVWPITVYCTKFRYILLEWHGLLLRRSQLSILSSCVLFVSFLTGFFDLGCCCRVGSSPALKATLILERRTF